MNILQVHNSAILGGMEKHVGDLSQGLIQRGNNVYLVCSAKPEDALAKLYEGQGIKLLYAKINLEIDPKYISYLYRLIKNYDIDVVHVHELKAATNASIAARLSGVPVVTHTHTPISTWRVNPMAKLLNLCMNLIITNLFSSCEIALTESIKVQKMREGTFSKKLRVIPNGLYTSQLEQAFQNKTKLREYILSKYGIPKDRFIFGNVSRLTVEKDHKTMLKAFYDFLKHTKSPSDFHLLIAGGGTLEEELLLLADKLGLKDNLTITGVFPDDAKGALFAAFDCFLFTTLTEGFGIVMLEALYFNLPVICTSLPVLKEVGGEYVYAYVEPGEDMRFSEKMQSLVEALGNTSYAHKSNLSHDYVSTNCSMDSVIEKYEELYGRLVR